MARFTLGTKQVDPPSLSRIFGHQAKTILAVNADILAKLLPNDHSWYIRPWVASFTGYAKAIFEVAEIHSDFFGEGSNEELDEINDSDSLPDGESPTVMVE